MSIDEYITGLRKNNDIVITVADNELVIEAPQGALDNGIISELKTRKGEILDFFKANSGKRMGSRIYPAAKSASYPLSSGQKRLYFLHELDRSSLAYNMPKSIRMEGLLHKSHVELAFENLIRRHESLRTSFGPGDSEVVQKVEETAEITIEYYAAGTGKEEIIRNFIRPFDLGRAPLFRLGIIETGPREHILLFDMHHIIGDGVSEDILINDFTTFYSGGQLPDLRLQYKDYAVWQQGEEHQREIDRQKAFWLTEFSETTAAIDLPLDWERPLNRSYEGSRMAFGITEEETAKLQSVAGAEGATLFMAVLSVFTILLGKLTGQEDIVVGTPVAGRVHEDLDAIVGMFVNTIPLRNYPKGELCFREFLAKLRSRALSAFGNQSYPLEELIYELNVPRDTGRNPLFDVLFVFEGPKETRLELPGLTLTPFQIDGFVSKFDLTLTAYERNGKMLFELEYCTRLFRKDTIERFFRCFRKIMRAVTADVNIRIADIDITEAAERYYLLNEFNSRTGRQYSDETVISLFERQAERTPDHVALSYEDRKITYGELKERMDAVATYLLQDAGVGAGDLVGILLDRNEHLVPVIYGILRSGAAYVPMDPNYPAARIQSIVNDSRLKVLIARDDRVYPGVTTITVDQLLHGLSRKNAALSFPIVAGHDLAYVIYTSGSTGEPKGVMIEHHSLANIVQCLQERYPVGPADCCLLKTSVCFDVSLTEIFGWFFNGGRLSILIRGAEASPAEIINTISRDGITHVNFVPSLFAFFVEELESQGTEKIGSLKYVFLAGEALSGELVRRFQELCPGIAIENIYGPTEGTIYSCGYSAGGELHPGGIPIGKPLENINLYVTDRNKFLQPIGVPGELWIGGKAVARGYINNAGMTGEKFIPDPFSPGGRVYKTGDWVRLMPDGNIRFLGRIDQQVKIRGFRIELGEIEAQLATHEQVKDPVVIIKGMDANKHLIAYYVSVEEIPAAALRGFLADRLPEYMIPAHYVRLARLPVNANGKLDRKALPDPDIAPNSAYVAPAGDIQRRLAAIWSKALRLEENRISVTANFFELGGHSLKAISIVNQVHKEFGVDISLQDLFRHQDIAGLSGHIQASGLSDFARIEKAGQKDHYRLSSAQQRLYFLYEFDKQSLAYNIPMAIKVEGRLDGERLSEVFGRIVARHESLRTCFEVINKEAVQSIAAQVPLAIESYSATETEIPAIIGKFIRPFDLGVAPLMRVGLIGLSEKEHILLVDVHHIVTDGVSQNILINEFETLYNGGELPEVTLQYKDYSEWQNGESQHRKLARQKEFWLQEFASLPESLDLPYDHQRPPVKSSEGSAVYFEIDREETEKLKGLAERMGSTPYMVLLSAYSILLNKLSGQEDIVVGTPVAGRDHADMDDIMGLFINTLAIRTFPNGSLPFREFLLAVKTRVVSCFDNQMYQYEDLIDALNVDRDTSRNPLFEAMFDLHNFTEKEFDIPGLTFSPMENVHSVSKMDLTLNASEVRGRMLCYFEYSTSLFKEDKIRRFVSWFKKILSLVIQDPEKRLVDIGIMDETEKSRMLQDIRKSPKANKEKGTFFELFALQAERAPYRTAIADGGTRVTYEELYRRSAAVSRHLKGKNVQPGARVAVLLPRGIELLTSVIGILRARGVYTPVDIHYSPERIRDILSHTEPSVILTNRQSIPELNKITASMPSIKEREVICFEEIDQETVFLCGAEGKGSPDDIACLLYTSGTGGRPKAVMIDQAAMLSQLQNRIRVLDLQPDDSIAQTASPGSVSSVWQLLAGLLTGARVEVLDREDRFEPWLLLYELEQGGITLWESTPSLLTIFLDQVPAIPGGALPKLETMILSGEPVPPGLVTRWYSFFPSVTLLHAYGMAEVCGDVAVTAAGRPFPREHIYILDSDGNLCPTGVRGQLFISGPSLARGYWRNKERTGATFIPNPFSGGSDEYSLLHMTGDMGYYLATGGIVCTGRMTDPVVIRGNRVNAAAVQQQLDRHPGILQSLVVSRPAVGGHDLIGYYVSNEKTDPEQLREFLTRTLPGYMIPAYLVLLERFPLTSNGKPDRKALPEPAVNTGSDYEAPETELEKILADTWSAVLGVKNPGVMDNFFSIGGDSIKSIQIISRLRTAGYLLTLKDIFTSQTIRGAAAKMTKLEDGMDQAAVTGETELTPIQRWFFERPIKNRNHYNQSVMLHFPDGITAETVRKIIGELQNHHDALRMVFIQKGDRVVQETKTKGPAVQLDEVDLRGIEDPEEAILAESAALQAGMNLANGPLIRTALLQMTTGSNLLIAIHHLVVDGVSWRILFEDIDTLYQQIGKGEPCALPAPTAPFQSWSGVIEKYTQSQTFLKAKPYWDAILERPFFSPVADDPEGSNLGAAGTAESFSLSREETIRLLTETHSAFNTRINDLLLTALFLAIKEQYGSTAVRVDLEGHGREEIGQQADFSRTTGWFTTLYPVLLTSEETRLPDIIKEIKEQLRAVPGNGIGYLPYCQLRAAAGNGQDGDYAETPISFNYLGQFDADMEGHAYKVVHQDRGDDVSGENNLEFEWSLIGIVSQGQLTIGLTYSKHRYKEQNIRRLLAAYKNNLIKLIACCRTAGRTEMTPSDLTYTALSIRQVNTLQSEYALKDVYPLSLMQEGILFHSLLDPAADHYFEQMTCRLKGDLDLAAVEKSGNDLIAKYDILRTLFLYDGYERPIQVVLEERKLDFSYRDIREECAVRSGEEAVRSYQQEDKRRKFDLSKDVLMRLTVLRLAGSEFVFIWSHHHILMDGWCMSIILNEFSSLYAANRAGKQPVSPPVTQYSTYIEWLEKRDRETSLSYWRQYLADYDTAAGLPKKETVLPEGAVYEQEMQLLRIDEARTKQLYAAAAKYGVTLNSLFQAAWGILLSKYNNTHDVVFASVVSGRSAEIAGIEEMLGLFINTIPVRVTYGPEDTLAGVLTRVQSKALECEEHHYSSLPEIQSVSRLGRDLLDHLIIFENYLVSERIADPGTGEMLPVEYTIEETSIFEQTNYDLTILIAPGKEMQVQMNYNSNRYEKWMIEGVLAGLDDLLQQITSATERKIADIDIVSDRERRKLLDRFNRWDEDYPREETLVSLFERQAQLIPGRTAVVFEREHLTFGELNERANRLAHTLREKYKVGPDDLIAIMTERSADMMVGLLGILKSGAAYIPIDPQYPEERIAHILRDSMAAILVTGKDPEKDLPYDGAVVRLDSGESYSADTSNLSRVNSAGDLCYMIYTSGSTGTPKGVMISHKNVVNFFFGMNERLGIDQDDCMLAVTSTSFDISVLELFWTLCHGAAVVIHPSDISMNSLGRYIAADRGSLDFSLFFFSSYNSAENDKYRLLLEAAKYADQEGFKAVWTPERHFHEFGGLYPNPSVMSAALAMITKRIELRSGSIVSPLHDPVRIAEEWAVVDNLSAGRVGLSFASGWNPNDFVLASGQYKERVKTMYAQINEVKTLWSGGTVKRRNGAGQETEVRTFPAPVQKQLPVWITSAGSEETFKNAGALGANILTHFLGQDTDQLAKKIRIYREARTANGYGQDGIVTVMLHTFIGTNIHEVEKLVEKPFIEYLKSSVGLTKLMLEEGEQKDGELSEKDEEVILKSAFKRYYTTGSLIGTKSSCSKMVQQLKDIGVNEIACLVDFGLDEKVVLDGLKHLNELRKLFPNKSSRVHRPVTMMQSTPSMIRMTEGSEGAGELLRSLRLLLLGGEAVPAGLVNQIRKDCKATLFNMYGPTETTIWSCVHEFEEEVQKVLIGKPILNTQIYILDRHLHLMPVGVAGDLYIGGEGLSRGYWNREELTAERFIPSPFGASRKIYKTGDVARWLPDGTIEFIGRNDFQVKIRGHRIELGEIESALSRHPKVKEAVVTALTEKSGDGKYLAAYVVAEEVLVAAQLREWLDRILPEYMMPGYFIQLSALPLTPNGKIDRKALPAPDIAPGEDHIAPRNETEEALAELWSGILGIDKPAISVTANFFEIGGHSLKATILVNKIFREFNVEIPLQRIFAVNTIEKEAEYILNEKWIIGQAHHTDARRNEIVFE